MKKSHLYGTLYAVVSSIFTMSSHAALIDNGNGLIYDDVLDITWMQDANYAQTSGYDADGIMTWSETMNWASNVVYAGHSGWRLPSALNSDGTGPCLGDNCTDSEFGHIILADQLVISPASTKFKNIQADLIIPGPAYWTSTEFSSSESWVWSISRFEHAYAPKSLIDDLLGLELTIYGWAVHDGDVAAEISLIDSLLEPFRATYLARRYGLFANFLIDEEATSDTSMLVLLTPTGYDIFDPSASSTDELPTENLALLSPAGLIALHVEAVPEPTTLALLSLGLVGLGFTRRKMKT